MTAPAAVRPPAILDTGTDLLGRFYYAFMLAPGCPPRTKKTSNQAVRMGKPCPTCKLRTGPARVFPSKAFREWEKSVTDYVSLRPQLTLALATPVSMRALVYRETAVGDLVGYLQAICDVLQECGIVLNDRLIADFDGSRLLKDANNPRVELVITVLRGDVQEEIAL